MKDIEEVFISYSHDSVEHITMVLELSNKLRSEGVDCVIDQYETSPPEGWPRWMDKKVRDAKYVIVVCTEKYYKRVMGEEEEGVGNGIKWEATLVYQHLYDAGTLNTRFIPIVFQSKDTEYIPTPLKGASFYSLDSSDGYESLYAHLSNQPKVQKPPLGKRREPLPERPVKTNPALYISNPIDSDLWDKAKWSGTIYCQFEGEPPILGLGFRNKDAAIEIFKGWHERYGNADAYEELRVSIIEGKIEGEDDGYSVVVGTDPGAFRKRLKSIGYQVDDHVMMLGSRIQRMNPPPNSNNLENFKKLFRQYKTYYLAPVFYPEGGQGLEGIELLEEFKIFKSKILFRDSSEIGKNDLDSVIINLRHEERNRYH